MTDAALSLAWDAVLAATPPGWWVGRPSWHHETQRWRLYGYDTTERPVVGKRTREVTATGETEAACVAAMALDLGRMIR